MAGEAYGLDSQVLKEQLAMLHLKEGVLEHLPKE